MFCDEFHLVDLRVFDNCKKVATNVDHVFNLAADMGGMGFIQSNHSVIFYNNTMISFNMMEAARQTNVKRCVPPRPHAPRLEPPQGHSPRGEGGGGVTPAEALRVGGRAASAGSRNPRPLY